MSGIDIIQIGGVDYEVTDTDARAKNDTQDERLEQVESSILQPTYILT